MRIGKSAMLLGIAALVLALAAGAAAAIADVKPYAVGIAGGYETKRLLSVGDTVPETSHGWKRFRMVGIPDGLGAHRSREGTTTVYMNHELTSSTVSEPVVGEPLNRGAFVSKLILDRDGKVLSGERAYDWVFQENEFVGPAAAADNDTRALSRFCSGSLAGPEEGSTASSTSRTRRRARRRARSTARAARRSRSWTTSSTRSRSSATSPSRTRSSSPRVAGAR